MAIVCGDLGLPDLTFDLDLSALSAILGALSLPSLPSLPSLTPPIPDINFGDLSPSLPNISFPSLPSLPTIGCLIGEEKKCPSGPKSEYYDDNNRFLENSQNLLPA